MLRTLFWVMPARPGSRILTDRLQAPQARTHPTSCCGPATAVSVFYDDFLRVSFFQAKKKLRGAHLFLSCAFPRPQEQGRRRHVCTHTPHQAPPTPLRTTKNGTSSELSPSTSDDTPGTCDERHPWERRWCPQKALKEECLLTAASDAGANLPLKTTSSLPRRTCSFVLILL